MDFLLKKRSTAPIPIDSNVSNAICTHQQKNKKEVKNKRKLNQSLPYCSFSLIYQNQLISIVPMHLDGDLILFDSLQLDEDGEVRGVLQVYNKFKRISSLKYDINSKLLHVNLEATSHLITPLENINKRLLSLNDPEAKKLTSLLTLFQSCIEKMRHKVSSHPSSLSLKSDFEYKRFNQRFTEIVLHYQKYPMVGFRYHFSEINQNYEIFEVLFNGAFIETGFQNIDECFHFIQKNGLPDSYIPIGGSYFEFINKILVNSFLRKGNEPEEVKKIPMKLVDKEGRKMEGYLKTKFLKFENENYVEVYRLHFFHLDQKSMISGEDLNIKRKFQLKDQEESNEFFKRFYPHLLGRKEEEELEKTCKFRVI